MKEIIRDANVYGINYVTIVEIMVRNATDSGRADTDLYQRFDASYLSFRSLKEMKMGGDMKQRKDSITDFIVMCVGNLLIGVGIALFSASRMGNDPNSAFVMSLTGYVPLTYSVLLIIINSLYFCVQFLWGKMYIGIGTIINWVFVGIIAEKTLSAFSYFCGSPEAFLIRLLLMLFGVLILSLGASLYQTADLGISPYDSLSIMMADRLPLPYFWCRILTDSICSVVAFLCRGPIGLGTLLCAVGLGPFIHFFDEHISKKLCSNYN